jgi:hypothetical protein
MGEVERRSERAARVAVECSVQWLSRRPEFRGVRPCLLCGNSTPLVRHCLIAR